MAQEITLPVKLQLDNLQSIAKDMRSQLGNLKIGSAGYEKVSKVIADIEKRIDKLQVLSSRPFVDIKQFNELQKEILHAKDDLTKLSLEAGKIKFNDISLTSEQSNKLKEFDNQLKTINDSLKEVKENAKTAFLQSDAGKAWKEANPVEATKSFEVITRKIEEEVNKQETAIAKAKKAYEEYLNTTQTNDKYKNKINGALRNGTSLTDILKEQNLLNKVFSSNGNRFANGGRQILKDWLQDQFGLSQEAINSIVSGAGDKVYKAFSEMQENVKKTLRTERNRINNENKNLNTQTNNGKTFTDSIATAEASKASAETVQRSANQADLESIEIQKQLQTQYEETKDARDEYTQSIVRSAQESASMPQQTEKIRQGLQNVGDSADEASARFQKFDSAVSKLSGISNFINRYIGAYAIMRRVVTAIRNAFTNIKELDQTITNIAVVTNMSQGDLWGKIGEYTEKAQQYGVATKDVYTVSQLFYQQGLQTNQVMSLTTETLKMAKIAGMEYGDAANAMTVAIRAFNIEMSQAQQVTDTYSALAAKFAVSSAEIANAMEKTASSAANVGMSVQSTSAFMSVMIQTTRESAQNIGSALKSIISRYGEMKASPQSLINVDGEEVAFNKVDTALQSIGISIKDASGQFRDFDDVIMELAGKWNTLDNNTQRYIATVMAGNRQQSRFIALVSNSEELTRAMSTANNAENASIIQVAKTMDSLETKAQQLKNAFSQLYLDLHIEEGLKNIYDILTRIISTIGKLGTLNGVLPTLINIINFGAGTKSLINSGKQWLTERKKAYLDTSEAEQKAEALHSQLEETAHKTVEVTADTSQYEATMKAATLTTDTNVSSAMNPTLVGYLTHSNPNMSTEEAKTKLYGALVSGELAPGKEKAFADKMNIPEEVQGGENGAISALEELTQAAQNATAGIQQLGASGNTASQGLDQVSNSGQQASTGLQNTSVSAQQGATIEQTKTSAAVSAAQADLNKAVQARETARAELQAAESALQLAESSNTLSTSEKELVADHAATAKIAFDKAQADAASARSALTKAQADDEAARADQDEAQASRDAANADRDEASGKKPSGSTDSKNSKLMKGIGVLSGLARIAGTAITAAGAAHQDKSTDNLETSKILTGLGNGISMAGTGASMGMAFGPWGAAIGAIGGLLIGGFGAIWDGIHYDLKERYNNAKKELKSLQDDQLKKDAKAAGLKESIDNIVQLRKAMYDSKEDMQAYKEAMNNVGKEYPELITKYDEQGNAIVDLTKAENTLTQARIDAANAAIQASGKQVYVAEQAQEATGNAASSAQWLVERAESINTNTKDDKAIQKYAGEIDKILADYKDNEELFGGVTSGAELIGKSKGTKTSDLSLDEFKRLRNLLYDIYHAKGGELNTAENSAARNLITKNILSATSGYDPEMRRNIQESDSFNELAYQYILKRVDQFDKNNDIVSGEDLYKFSKEHDLSFDIISSRALNYLLNTFIGGMSSRDVKNFLSLDYSNFSRPEQLAKYLKIDNFDLKNNPLHQALAEQVKAANQEQIDWINSLVYNQGNISGVDNLNENLKGIQKLTYTNDNGDRRNTAGDLAWLFNTPGKNKLLGKYSDFISGQITEANSLAEEGYTVLAQSRLDALYKMGLELYKLDDTFQVELYDIVTQIDFANYDTIIDAQKKLEEYDKAHTEIDLLPMINDLGNAASNILFNINTLSQTIVSKITEASKDIDNIISTNQSGLSFDKALEEFSSLEASFDNIKNFSDAFTFDSSLKKYVYTVNGLEAAISQKENSLQKDIDKASETLETYIEVLSLDENENNFDIDKYKNKEEFIDSIDTKQFSNERVKQAYQQLAIKYYDQYKNGIKDWSEFLEAQIKDATDDFDFANIILQEYEANKKNQWFSAIDWSAILLNTDFNKTNTHLMKKLAESLGMAANSSVEDIINKYFQTTYTNTAARQAAIEEFNRTVDEGKISKYQTALNELLVYQTENYLSEATKQVSKTLGIKVANIGTKAEKAINAAKQFLDILANEIGNGSYTLEQYNQDAQAILDKTLSNQSYGKTLLDFASGEINSSALTSLAQTLGQKLTDIIDVETGEFKNVIFKEHLTYDSNTNAYKINTSFEEFIQALNYQYGQIIDKSSIEYIEALSSWNNKEIETQKKFKDNLTKELDSFNSANSNDILNVSYLYSIIGDSLNDILEQYGGLMNHGQLSFKPDAKISQIFSIIISEIEQTGELSAQEIGKLKDSLLSLFSNITSLISSGINGNLSNEGIANLQQLASNYGINNLDFVKTADGFKLVQHSAIELYNALKEIDSLQAEKIFDDINKQLQENNDNYKSISALEAHIIKLRGLKETADPTKKKQYEQELELAKEIKAIRSTTEDSSFDFMSNEIPGAQNNPINYYQSWATAAQKLQEASTLSVTNSKGTQNGLIDYQDWYNIVTEMGNIAAITEGGVEFGGAILRNAEDAAKLIEAGANALTVDSSGNVKVAMSNISEMGFDFTKGVDGFSGSIEKGIQEFARSQVDMLDSMIQFMETVVAMEKLGDVDIDANNKLDLGEIFDFGNLDAAFENLEQVTQFTGKYRDSIKKLIEWAETESGSEFKKAAQEMYVSWDGADTTMWKLLNTSEETVMGWSDELKGHYAAIIGAFYEAAKGNYDKDHLFDSIKQVFAGTGYEGSLKFGDMNLMFKYDTVFEIGEDGKIHVGKEIFDQDNEEAAIKYMQATQLKILRGAVAEYDQEKDVVTFKNSVVSNIDYSVDNGEYRINFSDGSYAVADSEEGANLAIATYAKMTQAKIINGEDNGTNEVSTESTQFKIHVKGDVDYVFTVQDGKYDIQTAAIAKNKEQATSAISSVLEENNIKLTPEVDLSEVTAIGESIAKAAQAGIEKHPISISIAGATWSGKEPFEPFNVVQDIIKESILKSDQTLWTEDATKEKILENLNLAFAKEFKLKSDEENKNSTISTTAEALGNSLQNILKNTDNSSNQTSGTDAFDINLVLPKVQVNYEPKPIKSNGEQKIIENNSAGTFIKSGIVQDQLEENSELIAVWEEAESISREIDYLTSLLGSRDKISQAAEEQRGKWAGKQTDRIPAEIGLLPNKEAAMLSSLISGFIDENAIKEKIELLKQELKNKQKELENISKNNEEDTDIDKNGRKSVKRNKSNQSEEGKEKSLVVKLTEKAREAAKKTKEDQSAIDFDAINDALKEVSENAITTSKDINTSGTNIISTVGPLVEIIHRFGEEAETAMGHVSKFGELAGGAEHPVDELGAAAATALGQVTSLGGSSNTAASSLNGLSGAAAAAAAALGNIKVNVSVNVATVGSSEGSPQSSSGGSKSSRPNFVPGATGTIGLANAKGTLMGELGPELVVSNGRYFVVGQSGPEIVSLAEDAIVFNHLQTKSLLEKGTSSGRGHAITNEYKATSYAKGNVNGGPAMADAASALAALKQLRAQWQALLSLSAKDLISKGSGGGGGGNDAAFVKSLERWYNLLQEIAKLEQKITYEQNKRSKIQSDFIRSGKEYFQSQKDSLKYLEAEVRRHQQLVDEQKEYFAQRRAELNTQSAFSSLYTFDESGQIKYKQGKFAELTNRFGGDSTSGKPNYSVKEQYDWLISQGYGYAMQYNDSGEKIDTKNGKDEAAMKTAIEAFWAKIESDQGEMQELHDSIEEHKNAVLEKQEEQNKILHEIEDNQLEVENRVMKAVEDQAQRQIDELQKQKDAIQESNEALLKGLNDQLSKERQMYENQQSERDLDTKRRRLSILQRSGGSAAEIASLQAEIDTESRDIYFEKQQEQIDAIQAASDNELEKLQQQIDLMTETLEYQKENGLLWAQVYEQMVKSPTEIADFIKQNDSSYWGKSPADMAKSMRDDLFEAEKWKAYAEDGQGNIENYLAIIAAAVDEEEKERQRKEAEESQQPIATTATVSQDTGITSGGTDHGKIDHYQYKQVDASNHKKIPIYSDGWTGTGSLESHVLIQPGSGNRYACKLCGYVRDLDKPQHTYDNGGIVPEDETALVHAKEGILTSRQTSILRNEILGSKPNSLMSLLMDFREAYNGLNETTYTSIHDQGNITFEHAEVNVKVDKLANDYDAARAGDNIMKEMLNIARKTNAQNRVGR